MGAEPARVREWSLDDLVEGVLVTPRDGEVLAAVLVLSGSSGRVEVARARLLAAQGCAAIALRWFGGPGQPAGICEVPLETFPPALDRLASLSSRIGVVGVSKGAEAALLLGVREPRITTIAAFSPPAHVWANVGPRPDGELRPCRSSWTWRGEPLSFVPYDDTWVPGPAPAAFRSQYEQSERTFAAEALEAAIPVERISGNVLVTGGGDDQMWPSDVYAARIALRRRESGLDTTVLTSGDAGHRLLLPGEQPVPSRGPVAHGGSERADRALGARAWHALTELLMRSE